MKEGVALQQLADVLPPPAPGGYGMLSLVAGVIVMAAAVAWWWASRRRRPRGSVPAREARRRLRELRTAWQSRAIDDREAAYCLAALLRLGLGLPQLTSQLKPAAVADARDWDQTLAELHALRYRHAVGSALSARCFEHADEWLAAAQRGAG
jgi:hypothetical protein